MEGGPCCEVLHRRREREYPLGFCEAFAEGLALLLEESKESMRFIEIFSGPNAPLSTEVAKRFWRCYPPDHTWVVMRDGFLRKPSEMKGDARSSPCRPIAYTRKTHFRVILLGTGEFRFRAGYRQDAVEAGKQPSFGKRNQLIPDGLLDPKRHLELAKGAVHIPLS